MSTRLVLASLLAALALPAYAQSPFQAPITDEWAQKQVQAYVDVWSTDAGVTAQSVETFYAPRAVYYGKSMSRAQILADKRRYVRAWPERRYRMVPGSVRVRCDAPREICRATGVMEWSRRSASGRRVVGASRMDFTLTRSSGGKIVRESAVTLR
ncbi:MAG: hypothetical protein Q7T73_17345 [Beijerinckiaceae bacterium]|nr:hypothetical protein [Beijerinckiaceae bacterium]